MKRVLVSPEVEASVRLLDAWWRENRPAAPTLFLEELAEAFELLRTFSRVGHAYPHPRVRGVRRVLLRASRFHVYYVVEGSAVLVLAVWSAVQGRGPDLRRT